MRCLPIAVLALTASVAGARAQGAPPEDNSKVAIHGYLSQAFAVSDGHQVFGIPDSGTTDYRTAAVQLRATVSASDAFVIQLAQERLGDSPVMQSRSEVDLDWIFYERRLSDSFSVRVGKVKIPIGIYNEIRYVGPLLPFFRAAETFYGEGSYTFDSVNGAVVSSRLFSGRRFSVDADVYGGEWRILQVDNATYVRAKKGLGAQLWLNTPVHGLRAGLGGHRATWHDNFGMPAEATVAHQRWVASVDANFARFRFNVEFANDGFDGGVMRAAYLLGSWRVTDKLSLNVQTSTSRLRIDPPVAFDAELTRDHALALSYAFRRDLVLKVENHWARGRMFDDADFGTDLFAPPLRANYLIVSLSTLF